MPEQLRVLIVDDEEELLSTLLERLEIRGVETVGVMTGQDALNEVEQTEFDVVVLDVKLKGEDGVDVMKRIQGIRPELPVILLTGHLSQDTNREGREAGAFDYLLKPTDLDVLIAKMQEAAALKKGNPE